MSKKLIRLISVVLCLFMLVGTFAACGSTATVSSEDDGVLRGDAVDYDDGDDEYVDTEDETVTTTGTNSTSSTKGTASGSTGASNNAYKVDESAKTDFISSIPKSLSGTTVKILVWWTPGVAEKAKMEEFTKKTGIKIKWIQSSDYNQKLASMIAQGNSPDIACIQQDSFPQLIMQDYFQDLSAGKFDLSDTSVYDIDTMNKFKYNGKHYGVVIKGSTHVNFNVLIYNADIFAKAKVKTPNQLWQEGNWNWDTFISTCQEIMQKDSTIKAAITGEYQCHDLVQTSGYDLVEFNNGKAVNKSSSADVINAWRFVNELSEKYKVLDSGINVKGFYEGKTAMALNGNFVMQKGDSLEKNCPFTWGFAPTPSPKGQKVSVSSGVQLWGLPAGSKNTEAASYALRYWHDPKFDVEGYETWYNDDVAKFNTWLWDQNKTFQNFKAVVNYGGNYKWSTLTSELASCGVGNVQSKLNSWSTVIDSNIAKLEKEFGN